MGITIVITSAGGLVGTYLIRHLKATRDCRIVALDVNRDVYASVAADEFHLAPRTTDEAYPEAIRNVLAREKPDVFLPVASHDVAFFAARRKEFPVDMLVTDAETNTALADKRSCYRYLGELGIQVPRVMEAGRYELPCVVKPARSTGSRDTAVVRDAEALAFYTRQAGDRVVTEYLEGDEYTVDCLFDRAGRCLGANVRKRIKTVSGGAVVTRNERGENVDNVLAALERTGRIVGPVNFQYKRNGAGEPVVFDFNTRLPSGGLPLTVRSGFDIPNRMIDLLLHQKVEPWRPDPADDGLTMVRYYDEVFLQHE
jgi:carbamoyl-phosphate synthase large subunit